MKTNKRFLFCICGFAGGAVGAILAELVPNIGDGVIGLVFFTSLWSLVGCALITVGLFAAGEIYNRRPFSGIVYKGGLFSGAIAGAIAGFIAQSVYSVQGEPNFFNQIIFRVLCWALMGAILGWRLSAVVPNLGFTRGMIAGGVGGFFGGIGFIVTGIVLPEFVGRVAGLGILGSSLGLAVVSIEEMFRSARLDVVWAANEVTTVTLGPKPVYIGGGDDQIFVAGLPQHALGVVLDAGKIQCIDSATNKRSDLKEGSKIQIGKVEVIVRTKAP